MSLTHQHERGSIMLEILLSSSLIVVAGLGLYSFAERAMKTSRRYYDTLAPRCATPTCTLASESATCSCGARSFAIVR